jgi:hypothetical protein
MVNAFRIALFLLLAAPATAYAADASITSRDVPLRSTRSPAALNVPQRFDMVGLHWRGSGSVDFRTRSDGGRWSAWRPAAPEDDRPDAGVGEISRPGWRLGNPWWARGSNRLEVRTTGRVTRVRAWFVRSSAARIPLRRVSVAGSPEIITRRAWNANEKSVRSAPRYAPVLRLGIVHHTAGSNSYRPEDSAAIVRGIELYHVKANGWDDIGYNFLVDRYGQVFEGRAGGMQRNVIGAHAQGFNTGSTGVALLGTYSGARPTREAERALATLLAWRLDVAHLDPASSGMISSGGNPRFMPGAGVYLRTISGHRDADSTACPGDSLYSRLGALIEVAATTGLPKLYEPVVRGTIGKVLRFSARLSSPLAWTVTVRGPDGSRVVRKTGTGDRIAWSWNSAGLPAGRYEWTMEGGPAVRPARGVIGSALPKPKSKPAVPRPPLLSGLTASPDVVSPDGDGYADETTVQYTLSERSLVTVTIQDEADLPVAALLASVRQSAGTKSLRWLLDTAPDGRYQLSVMARSDSGRSSRLTTDLVVMRSLRALRAEPSTFSPDGDGLGDTITFSFVVAKAGEVAVEVREQGFPLGLVFSGWLEPGPYAVDWNGRLGDAVIAPGSYEVWVTLSDDIGIVSQTAPFAVLRRQG